MADTALQTARGTAAGARDPRLDWAEAGLGGGRRDWLPLRTLTLIRWFAVAGQVAAVLVATQGLGLSVATGGAALVIGAAVLVNLLAQALFPLGRRLSEREVAAFLVFDILQLGALLGLTGGLNNPFAMLILAPGTVAATVLGGRAALGVGALTVAIVTALALWHVPIEGPGGPFRLPPLILLGFWTALLIGVAFLGVYARQVTREMTAMGEALAATRMALAREQRLTDLGGVVAAAAHELGTPLATIALVSGEMIDELRDRPALLEDARLLRAQAQRCRDILRAMAERMTGATAARDPFLDRAPAEAVLREAAEPHMGRGREVRVVVPSGPQPALPRRPEIVHGLRNLVQNAVDFASAAVTLRLDWGPDPEEPDRLSLRISDDGPGFAPAQLDRAGEPPVGGRRRARADAARPAYEGMGLGLFIAKTLLERTGARLTFANAPGGGAVVVVSWPLAALAEPPDAVAD